ncbi:phage portal protein [Microbacterium sp. A1-JK]|uniref:phage portal protein n=1 Tax=Microbacterium sp. A1-JK TaxID=3177516 RepID=UPI00388A11F1
MVFAVSEGKLLAVQKPTYAAPTALRISDDLSEDYASLYRKQPAVRTVVDFLARNVAQLSLQTFERVGDTDRRRLTDHPLAQMLRTPNPYTTSYRLIRDLISDRGIYDRALWVKVFQDGRNMLVRVPPRLWTIDENDNWLRPTQFIIKGNRGEATLSADRVVYFRGYNPEDERYGLSPIESLRRILSEEYAAGQMREQVLRNGARVSGYIERPAGADWSQANRDRFRAGWRAQYSGQSASEGGGTPILEDGMKFVSASQTAADLQYIEARKLSREEAAAAYFIPPPMVGILDHATFGNITEQHKMLYQDTLGPILQDIQQEIELQVLPDFDNTERVYVEFNMMEKLRGSFEEQAAQLQTSVGAPFLTRNEARGRANLPSVEGGDELVVPLNVLVGGQASPRDGVTAGGGGTVEDLGVLDAEVVKARLTIQTKARPDRPYITKATQVLADFFTRQAQVVKSNLGAKADASWWDSARWNRELADSLFAVSSVVTEAVAIKQIERMGLNPDDFDLNRTLNYLRAVAKSNAESINAATESEISDALDSDEDPLDAVSYVFEKATSSRADQAGLTLATAVAGFASVEAVEQVRGTRSATKTWITTSSNPRASHAAMNGETVPIDDTFSNGARWPGDSSALDVDDIAGCGCDVQISFE